MLMHWMNDMGKPKTVSNVGLFCEVFPPVMDGVSVCMSNYANWLQKKVGGVTVVTPSVPGADYGAHDFKVLDYLSFPVPTRRPYVTGLSRIDPVLHARIAKNQFRIIHAHTPFSAGNAALHTARKQGVPLVATFHSKYRDDFEKVFPKPIVNMLIASVVKFFEGADLVWTPLESAVEVLREYGYKGPVEVMPNGCDFVADYPENFRAGARQRLGVAPETFMLLFVGQHIWQKNPQLTIEALSRLEDVPFHMYFVGTGHAAEGMKAMVSEKGLYDKVTFVGPVAQREKIVDYYAAADLFAFPSLYDTAGLVVQEAAALGTPSILAREATAATAITEGKNGFLTDNDPDKMAQLIRELAHDPERVRRVGMQASRTLVRSWEDCVGEVIDRYNALLKHRGMAPLERIDSYDNTAL